MALVFNRFQISRHRHKRSRRVMTRERPLRFTQGWIALQVVARRYLSGLAISQKVTATGNMARPEKNIITEKPTGLNFA
jgi:hypothetical protein